MSIGGVTHPSNAPDRSTGSRLLTIGFTRTSAEAFFGRLKASNVVRLIDVRLHNTSQLAGFAKANDLRYFARAICGIEYVHEPLLAPEDQMLKDYRAGTLPWSDYERAYIDLLTRRDVLNRLVPSHYAGACLLCSEDTAHHCHRRLAAEHLSAGWNLPGAALHL